MDNMLDRNNKHLFLDAPSNKNNSFIANINKLVARYNDLVDISSKFTEEDIELLTKLVKEEVDINIEVIAEDLKKGNYLGYRKLDIDLLTNFKDYEEGLSDEEKNALWNNVDNQVYYDNITVYFNDSTHINKTFSELVNNHHKLYDEINTWNELKEKWGATSFNIFPDTPILNHELLRIWDTNRIGSNIDYIILHVAPQGQNQQYDAAFSGAKSYSPSFSWLDTTSTLMVIAHRINEIIETSDYIEQMGATFVDDMTELKNLAEQYKNLSLEYANSANEYASKAEEALNKQQTLTVAAKPIAVNEVPQVEYNGITNTMTFSLPRSEIAVVGLSKFAIDTANGHLSFVISNESDVKSVYVDENTGNVIIELNK